jgi:AraC-like DNA-binding protein
VATIFIFFSLLIGVGLVAQVLDVFEEFPLRNLAYLLFLSMFLGLLVLRQVSALEEKNLANSDKEKPSFRYKNYQLDKDDLEEVVEKIFHHLDQTKAYKNSEYTLDDLAEELGISRLKITQALNVKLGENFYQVINRARAKESKRLLEHSDTDNISMVGFDSGFKSKSTFYKYFKEEFGSSPGDFKRNISSC